MTRHTPPTPNRNHNPLQRARAALLFAATLAFAVAGCATFEETLAQADAGDTSAMYSVGMSYASGNGVEKNLAKAEDYLARARLLGDKKAERALILLYVGNGMIEHWDEVSAKIKRIAQSSMWHNGLDAEMLEKAPVFSMALVRNGELSKRKEFDRTVLNIAAALYEANRSFGQRGFSQADLPEIEEYKTMMRAVDFEESRIALAKKEAERKASEAAARIAREKEEMERKNREEQARVEVIKRRQAEAKARAEAEERFQNASAQTGGMFAQAKQEADNAVRAYADVWNGYFRGRKNLLSAAPMTDQDGNPAFVADPENRSIIFTMRVAVDEDAYGKWLSESVGRLSNAGIPMDNNGGLRVGDKTFALSPSQATAVEKWLDGTGKPAKTVFRAMLVDAHGDVVRQIDIGGEDITRTVKEKNSGKEWGQLALMGGDDAVAFAAGVAALSGEDPYEKGKVYEVHIDKWKTGRAFPLKDSSFAMCRLKESPEDWAKEIEFKTDDEAAYARISFEKLTDAEMARCSEVKCVILDSDDLLTEKIAAARVKWQGREEEAKMAVLQILADMIKVPGQNCALGRYEVRQSQWMAIMESNPAKGENIGAEKPAVGAGFDEVAEFIVRLNAYPSIADAGIHFRLPSKGEWKSACLAGSTGDFGLLANGKEGKLEEMAWYGGDSWTSRNDFTFAHEIGTKMANGWGFYDMHGNAWERIAENEGKITVGGGFRALAASCTATSEYQPGWRNEMGGFWRAQDDRDQQVGFRLCADWSDSLKTAIGEAESQLEKPIEPIDRHAAIQSIVDDMTAVPGTDVRIGKFELTQLQWEAVMGSNPSSFKGANRPVENFTLIDVEKFFGLLNASEEVSAAGLQFRLPKKEEWTTAALAGGNTIRSHDRSEGKYGLLADGTEGKPNDIAWHGGYKAQFNGEETIPPTSNGMTHPVGKKTPNAFGLYDMHGNVAEVVSQQDHFKPFVAMGGSWNAMPQYCSADSKKDLWNNGTIGSREVGIRLCAESVTEKPIRTQTKQK